ncbi:MAG TPA: Gfo/Idh/MocA family oxidoreductase [Aggregatilinea sp.]|jgi:predicted dehydrogenase|uniref:Gfo/Idh/MocA family protein n=1 Tax=Aggregatilinea sp. TaxID=2806333 RepID=UPI002C06E4C7|nr:Gfo/Idh/MocA family oxidoreductase [Aggregatilinea sp.]HML21344.1 Gfo/Idh/MocA family oxidoreductase [Aggregatilinea sp.]
MDKVRIGVIGSGFISNLHVNSLHLVPEADVVAVASLTTEVARQFADEHGIPDAYDNYEAILKRDDIDAVTVGIPNDLHEEVVVAAAQAGKHILCEKPLARSLPEGERMMAAVHAAGVKLVYGEMLCFAPKYVRAKKLIQEGALGKVFLVKQSEEHDGPHSPWFWDVNRSGGGVLLDMGCHSIEFARWILDRPRVKSVQATLGRFMHSEKTLGEDHSIVVIEFENGAIAMAENSWAKTGGIDDRCEIYGTLGNTRADLVQGVGLRTHSKVGYGYAVEKADSTMGWTFTGFEEEWTHGFPQEMRHFVNVVQGKEEPTETGEDGLEVLRIIYAAYQSAGEGRRIEWPYTPPEVDKPVDLWLNA